MGHSKISDRIVIQKYFERGVLSSEIIKLVKPLGIIDRFVYRTIKRLKETGCIKDRQPSGRPRTARTKDRINRVKAKIKRNPQRSKRQLAKEENISKSSMRRILSIDLRLKPLKI